MRTESRAAISVDLELFRHTPAFRSTNGRLADETLGLEAVDQLLSSFESAGATATFFVVSEIAEDHPGIIERIAAAGHEIGSHTHTHRLLTDIDREQRRTELRQSRELLESVSGQPVRGFRAPAFDLPEDHFTDLSVAGYGYDSSINPCRTIPGWYGGRHDTRQAVPADTIDSTAPADLIEIPIAISPFLKLPVGGAWTRLLGRRYTLWGTQAVANNSVPPVLYTHPWEFCDIPPIEGVPKRVTWRTGQWMIDTFEALLSLPFDFISLGALADEIS